jgi:hypothetical protein
MTNSNTPPQEQSSPAPDNTHESESDKKEGFFNRVQRVLSRTKPVHPSEAEEIVIMDEGDGDR